MITNQQFIQDLVPNENHMQNTEKQETAEGKERKGLYGHGEHFKHITEDTEKLTDLLREGRIAKENADGTPQ